MENEAQEIEKYNKKLIEESNASSFYNDSIKRTVAIAKTNKENPAKMRIEMDAYIDGSTKEIPTLDAGAVKKPMEVVSSAFVKESTQELANKQLDVADKTSLKNTFDAADMARVSIEQNYPQEADAVIQSNFAQLLDDDVKAGRLKAKEAIQLLDLNNETQVRKLYGDFILDENTTVEKKLVARRKIIDGKTGNPNIDQLPLGMRVQALNSVEEEYSKLEKREKEIIERDEYLAGKRIEDALLSMDSVNASDEKIAIEKERLRRFARNKEQLEMINKWSIDDWEPTQKTSLLMEEAERNGVATKEFYEDLLSNHLISYKTYREKASLINRAMQETMKTDAFQQAKQELTSVFGYTGLGENKAYNIAMNAMMQEIGSLGRIASREDVELAKKKAIDIGKAFPGYSADDEKNNQTVEFYKEHNYAIHQMDDLEKKARDVLFSNRSLTREIYNKDPQKSEQMIGAEMQRQLIASGKSKLDAMKMIAKWKKIGKEM